MKKLSVKMIGGIVIGTAAVGACALGASQFLNANHNNLYGFYENEVLPVEKSNALIEAEEDVREANAKVDAANEEFNKKTEAKETAVKNLETAKNAVKNAEETVKKAEDAKKKAEEQVKSAKTDEERKAAEEKVKAAESEAERAAEEKRLADEAAQKAEAAKKLAEEEAQKAEEAKKVAEEQARKAEEVRKAAEEEAQRVEAAKKAEEEARKAEEARKVAEEEAQKLEEARKAAEEAKNVEEAKRLAEEANRKAEEARLAQEEENRKAEEAKKAQEEAQKATAEREAVAEARRLEKERLAKEEAERQAAEQARKAAEAEASKKATTQSVAETKPIVEEQTPSVTQSNSTPSVVEDPSPSEDAVTTIKNAVTKTAGANSLTVRNVKEQWTKMYDNNSGTELIVYYNGSDKGVLYSYTNTSNVNAKQVSLFRSMSPSLWTIPDASSIKGMAGWTMQFSGKRTVGVIELELVKKLRFLASATSLTESSLKGEAYNGMGSNIKFYRVAVSNKQFNEWLSTYYGDTVATDTVMIDIGINGAGYICYLKGTVLGNNKTRSFEIVLANANSTKVPTANELDLSNDAVLELEKKYRENYGCDIEWAKDKDGNDYYYWVCGPNKHVNQHDF